MSVRSSTSATSARSMRRWPQKAAPRRARPSDAVLAQMDIVLASVHSLFSQPREEMTARILRAIENRYVRILGHPTGRQLLRREAYELDLPAILRRAAEL